MGDFNGDPGIMFDPLAEGRQLLDAKNRELLAAFGEVLRLVGERSQIIDTHITPVKQRYGLPILQAERRETMLEAAEAEGPNHGVMPEDARTLLTVVHDIGVARQEPSTPTAPVLK